MADAGQGLLPPVHVKLAGVRIEEHEFGRVWPALRVADVTRIEMAGEQRVSGGVNENVFEDSIAPVHAAGQVQLWEDSHIIDAALRLEAAPGHTPGSSVLKLVSGSEYALLAGDLMHTPLQVTENGHNSCFCEDPAAAIATRRRLLGWASDHAALVLPAHFSGHGALEVEHRGDGFGIHRWAGFDRL